MIYSYKINMKLVDFQKLINTSKYLVSNRYDFYIINKYWNDLKL